LPFANSPGLYPRSANLPSPEVISAASASSVQSIRFCQPHEGT
jgi:hypothetical protein